MKIGILTFHSAPNHGAFLQAFALQNFLKKIGHDPFFINYQYKTFLPNGVRGWIGSNLGNTLEKWDKRARLRPFKEFQRLYFTLNSNTPIDLFQLQNSPPKADFYICGSDQVWNPNILSNLDNEKTYWLTFGGRNVGRIAYAPSFGVQDLDDKSCSRLIEYACNFDDISVRELTGKKILEKLGHPNAPIVPDPTLLLNVNDYDEIFKLKSKCSNNYIFSYNLRTRRSAQSDIDILTESLSSNLGLKVYQSYSNSFIFNILFKRHLSPQQWLSKLYNSSFVVTNSFHGTVFSILFHRPFITLLRSGQSAAMNDRIITLLDSVGLSGRSIKKFDSNQVESLCNEEIDWNNVDKKIKENKKTGENFLKNALKCQK